jgi:hypothetical protein
VRTCHTEQMKLWHGIGSRANTHRQSILAVSVLVLGPAACKPAVGETLQTVACTACHAVREGCSVLSCPIHSPLKMSLVDIPCFSRVCTTSTLPALAALCSTVRPFQSLVSREAPAARSASTTEVWPYRTAGHTSSLCMYEQVSDPARHKCPLTLACRAWLRPDNGS